LLASCATENITVVYGMEGSIISVNCTYKPWRLRWREKTWCKQEENGCRPLVNTWSPWQRFLRNSNGTIFITDNVYEGILTVTMKDLRKEDAGLYQCISVYRGEPYILQKVHVEVLAAVPETQRPEEPRAVQSISSTPPAADFTLFYILAGSLVTKLLVAVLIFIIGSCRKNREPEQKNQSLKEQQVLPATGDGISPFWESSA
ncbi:TREM2 protein, partial [Galbula dea]|nr:TREM2 protein [Galbula dea]